MDSFKWCTQIQGGAAKVAISNNIRSIVFGNGYIQTASSGINTKRRTVPIVYGGSDWVEVYNFCQDHVTKPFVWKAPDGRMGVFVVTADSVNLAPQGGGVFEVTAEFAERFTSAG